jgi:carbamoyltransferase
MNIVGVNISHDSSVCLMQDGKIIFYLEEERLSKLKSCRINKFIEMRTLNKIKNFINKIDYLIITTSRRFDAKEDISVSEQIVNQLIKIGLNISQVVLNLEHHHLHHAFSAFYFSGLESAVVLIMDGSGACGNNFMLDKNKFQYREIESIYKFNNNKYETLYKHYTSFAMFNILENFSYKTLDDNNIVLSNTLGCGKLFEYVCFFALNLGFNEAGKAMGMSSYGTLDKEKIEWFNKYDDHFLFDCNFLYEIIKSKIYKSASYQEQSDFVKKLQYETKEYTIRLIQKAIDLSDSNNVVLSGGYFQNCVNNYAYLKAFPHVNFYVDPVSYDGGTAIGACFYVWHNMLGNPNTLQKLDNLYLGPE